MNILTTAIVYSLMLGVIALLGVAISKDPTALLPLPFALATFCFAWAGRKPELYEKCLQTTLIITILLLFGTAGGVIQFLTTLSDPTLSLNTTLILQSVIFLISFCYAILAVIAYAKQHSA
ncbi:hypothetical protein COTS27_00552 [Spirochaetota bacterium]|nr:hypothetical protein COTS27_00552 [Spirochaetota bacterium]